MINPSIPTLATLAKNFSEAKPFKHICIDNFLTAPLAERLLQEFPEFDRAKAINEMGRVAGKSTREDVRALGPAYAEIDDLLSSKKFLAFISELSGIPDIQYDPEYFGGGTHENINGQELDVHVDFNYHRSSKLHRRLNLIIYLNKEWDPEWGGGIELHSDPRNPENNQILTFEPFFNRCVIFETNECSWHGFSQINLPAHKQYLSRKSFAVYFYSETRPASEIVPQHNTFYIQRPIPPEITDGTRLTAEQSTLVRSLVRKRDEWLHFYQRLELSLSGELDNLKNLIKSIWSELRIRSLGYILQEGPAVGYHPDRWIEDGFTVTFVAHKPIRSLEFILSTPPQAKPGQQIHISINNNAIAQRAALLPGHPAIISFRCDLPANQPFVVTITGDTFSPKELGINEDDRRLLGNLERIVAHHP
jgi:hypothetical protein